MDMETIVDELDEEMTAHMHSLNRAIAGLVWSSFMTTYALTHTLSL